MNRGQPRLKETVDVVAGPQARDGELVACVPTGDGQPEQAVRVGLSTDISSCADDQPVQGQGHIPVDDHVPVQGPGQGELYWVGKRLAVVSIALASILSYFAVHLLTSNYFWGLTDIQTTGYMHLTRDASGVGVLLTIVCYARLMRSFAGCKDPLILLILRAALAAGAIALGVANGGLAGACIAVLCCLGYYGMGWLGRQMRRAIPSTFCFEQAVISAGMACAPAALLTVFALYQAIISPLSPDTSSVYSNHAGAESSVLVALLFILLSIPTYVMVRHAHTSEAKPLIALGLLLQSPLALGFLVQLGMLSTGPSAVAMLVTGLGALFTAGAAVAYGSVLGAKVNGLVHRRNMKSAGESMI